ncbi:NUDIX domain-containing protein [Candidatus Bathyarchaeota archaeon]|nr:NUDIX domain-containing protein [Candidatus Bathyarchaeota archaeon]
MSREYPSRPIPGVAAITLKDHQVLLTVRGKEPRKGMWGIPGGVVEVGETLMEAVKREVFEETHIAVEPIELLAVFDSVSRDESGKIHFHYVLFEYLCNYVSGDVVAGDDAPDARWVDIDDLDSLPIMESTRRFIDKTLSEKGIK